MVLYEGVDKKWRWNRANKNMNVSQDKHEVIK